MAHRANAAKPLYEQWCFPIGMPLDKSFKTSELSDVKKCIFHLSIFIKMNRHLSMSFHSCNRVYDDFFVHSVYFLPTSFEEFFIRSNCDPSREGMEKLLIRK